MFWASLSNCIISTEEIDGLPYLEFKMTNLFNKFLATSKNCNVLYVSDSDLSKAEGIKLLRNCHSAFTDRCSREGWTRTIECSYAEWLCEKWNSSCTENGTVDVSI